MADLVTIPDMASDYRKTRYPNVHKRGEVLYFRYRDEHGKRVEVKFGSLGTAKDARDAQETAQERANKIRHNLIDPREAAITAHAAKPVAELLNEYTSHLNGRDPAHVKTTLGYIRGWLKACEVGRLAEADPHRLRRWLDDAPVSARTRNYRRTAVLGFCRWAADYGRIAYNPCPGRLVPKYDEDADRRRLSRSLSRSEFEAVVAVAPPQRQAYYLLAALTGLRWREIGRLTWGAVEGQALTVPAGQTKNKQRADLWMLERVAEALEAIRPADAAAGDRIFAAEPRLRTWHRDLIRAGLVRPYCDTKTRAVIDAGYSDDRGRIIDRKCLRMSYCTWLRDAGVDLRDAQRLMRHSSPALTANTYTDTRLVDLRRAVEKLDGLGETGVKMETLGSATHGNTTGSKAKSA